MSSDFFVAGELEAGNGWYLGRVDVLGAEQGSVGFVEEDGADLELVDMAVAGDSVWVAGHHTGDVTVFTTVSRLISCGSSGGCGFALRITASGTLGGYLKLEAVSGGYVVPTSVSATASQVVVSGRMKADVEVTDVVGNVLHTIVPRSTGDDGFVLRRQVAVPPLPPPTSLAFGDTAGRPVSIDAVAYDGGSIYAAGTYEGTIGTAPFTSDARGGGQEGVCCPDKRRRQHGARSLR